MNWQTFKQMILDHLGTNGVRRGIDAFRDSYIRAAMADLKFFVPSLQDGFSSYTNTQTVPFANEDAETLAEYVQSKITRYVDKNLAMAESHWANYLGLRRRTYLREHEAEDPVLEVWRGKPAIFAFQAIRNSVPMPLAGNIWMTVKSPRTAPDACAVQLTVLGGGIAITDGANGMFRATFSAEDTAALRTGETYIWDIQVTDENDNPVILKNLRGRMVARQPATAAMPA
ncbi:MAG: hypothetical protein KIT44_15920 [Opitutaceae bacterium]|nr:hypothetical protein [Opitutaceae bacterium]